MKTIGHLLTGIVLLGAASLATPTGVKAATFTVNRIGDQSDLNLANANCDVSTKAGNQCTLRAAIQQANATPGADTINFNITSASKTITPATPLPPITGRITINGYSQPNTSTNTRATGNNAVLRIILDGVNAGFSAIGLHVQANNSVIRGLVVQRFDGAGVKLDGSSNALRGNIIGTNAAGTAARGNGRGVVVSGSSNTVGGTTAATRNLISGNRDGVQLTGLSPTGNVIAGNYIGTTKNGLAGLGNSQVGVLVDNQIACVIGTGTSGGGNVISANGSEAIRVAFTDGCTVRGNLIGTRADATGDLGNALGGIQFIHTAAAVVGGLTGTERNVIAGNRAGVGASDSAVDVLGNSIVANDFSGLSFSGTSTATVQGNAIVANAASGGNGIQIHAGGLVRVTGNQILANGGLGINLVGGTENGFGVTANDTGDSDAGANGLQNYPVISNAIRQPNGFTFVSAQLNSAASSEFRIELFLSSGAADPSGHGEAQAPLAAQTITTNSAGNRSFTIQMAGLQQGHLVTMTATRVSTGATSEFSANVGVVAAP